jgi:DHA1 family bicyclomycin/chloramphenicol resistance-like MFS transporter
MVIGAFMLGMALAQVLFGPLSDSLGRKRCCFSASACLPPAADFDLGADFETMIVGRLTQGIGAAAPRVLSVAIVRDRFEGRQMAKTVSMIMTVSILVPVFAPTVGQAF